MKKLYRSKGTVHPSPPIVSDHLSFLPAAILTLTLALSPQDREVLAYLISSNYYCSPNPRRTTNNPKTVVDGDHPPLFHCSCFRCYMSYWVKWDSSPNHKLIHQIIDSYEDWLAAKPSTKKRNKRKQSNRPDVVASPRLPSDEKASAVGESSDGGGVEGEEEEKGSVRRLVNFIGEKIWGGGWGQ